MFRLSDLHKDKGKSDQPQPPPPATLSPVRPAASSPSSLPPPPLGPEAAKAMGGLEALYVQLLRFMKTLFDQARANQPLQLAQAVTLLRQLPQVKDERCEAVMALVERHTDENYLYSHSVNVALLVNHLGHCLGYSGEALGQLALAGLLLDIGMAGESEQLAEMPRKLTKQEWQTITQHPHESVKYLKDAQHVSQEALQAIVAHHEREKGQGYPGGLAGPTMNEFAKILAVCDVYDAFTHPRSYRPRHSPAQAVKILIDGVGDTFDRRVVKALVDDVSLYPRGSRVKLNTEEIGLVELVHPGAPLRPIVRITHDANQTQLIEPRRVNLLEQPFLYVKEILAEEDAPPPASA